MSKINSAYESCRTPNPSLPRRVWHMNQRKPEAQWLGRFNQHLKSETQKLPNENSREIFIWAPIKFKFWLSYPADTEFWQSTEFFSCPLSLLLLPLSFTLRRHFTFHFRFGTPGAWAGQQHSQSVTAGPKKTHWEYYWAPNAVLCADCGCISCFSHKSE